MKRFIYWSLSICLCVLIAVGLYFLITAPSKNEIEPEQPLNNTYLYPSHEYVKSIVEDTNHFIKHYDEKKLRAAIENSKMPDNSSVQYLFYPADKPDRPLKVTASKESISKIPYNSNGTAIFLLRGFSPKDNWDSHVLRPIVPILLKKGNNNVFHVVYTSLCDVPFSEGFTVRGHLVAKDLAKFIKALMEETSTKKEQVHLIGYSLGAQIVGYTGKYLPGLGKVTAIDPGDFMLHVLPEDLVLNRNDAEFVQVIHTNAVQPFPKGNSFFKPLGHLDFYPNGGKFQPGCKSTVPIDQTPTTLREIDARMCMHERSVRFYIESITNKACSFIGTACESYEKYAKGLCSGSNATTALFGHYATIPPKDLPKGTMFFLTTNENSPYCKKHQP